jgi:hypothetical protein
VLLIVKLSFDVSVPLLCGLYNTFTKVKTIIELEMDTEVFYEDFWYDLYISEEVKEM